MASMNCYACDGATYSCIVRSQEEYHNDRHCDSFIDIEYTPIGFRMTVFNEKLDKELEKASVRTFRR